MLDKTSETSTSHWDYASTPHIYCPHCNHKQEQDVFDMLPRHPGEGYRIGCDKCHNNFAVRAVQVIVWDVATTIPRMIDNELGPEE